MNGNAAASINRSQSHAALASEEAENVQVLPLHQSLDPKGPALTTSAPSGGGSNERCTKVLVGIVVVFLVCHLVRLVLQVNPPRKFSLLIVKVWTTEGKLFFIPLGLPLHFISFPFKDHNVYCLSLSGQILQIVKLKRSLQSPKIHGVKAHKEKFFYLGFAIHCLTFYVSRFNV